MHSGGGGEMPTIADCTARAGGRIQPPGIPDEPKIFLDTLLGSFLHRGVCPLMAGGRTQVTVAPAVRCDRTTRRSARYGVFSCTVASATGAYLLGRRRNGSDRFLTGLTNLNWFLTPLTTKWSVSQITSWFRRTFGRRRWTPKKSRQGKDAAMPGPRPALCTFPDDFVQEALDTVSPPNRRGPDRPTLSACAAPS